MDHSRAQGRFDKEAVKQAARGRWPEILERVGGFSRDVLDSSKEHPCPKCGGDTRARLIDEEAGAFRCSHCFSEKCGDGFAAIGWMLDCSFPEALEKVGTYLGMAASQNGKAAANGKAGTGQEKPDPTKFAAEVCAAKRIPLTAAEVYGYQPTTHGNGLSLDCPLYGPDGKQCSTFRLKADSKGLYEPGKPAGLFLPHDEAKNPILPTKGGTSIVVEGGKDSPAVSTLGYHVVGLPTSSLNAKFAELFRGVHVKVIPDLDEAGLKGARTTAKNLEGIAASFSIITLPGEKKASGGIDCRDVLAMEDGAEILRKAIDGAGPQVAERCTLAELRNDYPTLYKPVVQGLIRERETCNIISYPKVGKSWLAYLLALSVITGRRWLDAFDTQPGKVLIIDNELHKPTIAHRVDMVGEMMGLSKDQYDLDLEIISLRGKMMSLEDLAPTFEAIDPGEFKLAILDAKYRFATPGSSENDNAAEALLYNLVDKYADQTEAAFVLIHHASKGDQGDKRVTDVGAGAGAQSRAADAHLVLREHEEPGVAVLEAAVRSFAPTDPLTIRWHFPLWMPADCDAKKLRGRQTKAEQRQADRDREAADAVIKALLDGPATMRQLRMRTGYGKDKAEKAIFKLISEGHVKAGELTVKGRIYDEYSIAE